MKWFYFTDLQFPELDAPFSISDDGQKPLLFIYFIIQTTEIGPDSGYSLNLKKRNH